MNGQLEYGDSHATKNTCRFQQETFTDLVIGTLYAQKALFGDDVLANARATLEWE